MRIVLDTNVLISAIFFSGPPSAILAAWLDDRFELAVSAPILEEYRNVGRRLAAEFPGVAVDALLDRIAVHSLLVVPSALPSDACSDPEDVKFLECALAADADFVISGDRALLRASGFSGIKVVTPRRFADDHLGD